ncbi:ABC transporter G family member [Zostera marina]|uniref:ABC transporter G family member 5 n=1 Tax=Zostera marina TaxID=29655 RepID=A0A0K9NPK2_ZOSMR|nr:ABC transporter G family member [Zostera marina]
MSSSSDHAIDVQTVDQDQDQNQNQPFVLRFTNLTYSVSTAVDSVFSSRKPESKSLGGGMKKTLLNAVSGEGRKGEIVAVLGASGSGKSTLIDALAGRISRESLQGSITLNGEQLHGRMLKVISAYVMQDDLLFPMLTVEETLMFAADFRLPSSLSKVEKKARVQTLIDQLGLGNARNTIIGDEGHRGVSGGERRRVSIGVGIVHDPIILFLDEPMSGLDSTSAFMVVNVLQKIARAGSIVMMSIHQPSSRILGLLDHLIFLSRGNCVFTGTPDDLQPFFSDFGYPIPENENRTEFALDLIRGLEVAIPPGTNRLVEHNNSWKSTTVADSEEQSGMNSTLKDAISETIGRGKLASNPFWYEMGVLTRRAYKNTKRTPELFAARLATVMVTGIILATVYWKLDMTPEGSQERLGFFAFAMSVTFYTCSDTLPVFLQERYIFMRETSYNAYRRSSYVLSNSMVAIPFLVVLSLAFATTTFFAIGLYGGATGFGFYFLITLASFWAGSSFVTFLSGVVSNVMLGYTVVVAVLAYFLLLSGFFISRDRIPNYWIWLHYISLVKYPYEAVLHNEFDFAGRCFARGIEVFQNTAVGGASEKMKVALLGDMASTLGIGEITANTCLITGPDILRQQDITQLGKWECLLVTVAFGIFFRILFYCALLLGARNKRK